MYNTYLRPGLNILFRYIICVFLALMTFFSFVFIFSHTSTEEIGYKISVLNEETQSYDELYTYYYEDGEDLKYEEYEKQGLDLVKVPIRSEFEGFSYYLTFTISQLFVLAAFVMLLYGKMHSKGDSDQNKVSFGRMKPIKWYGFKMGMVTGGLLLIVYILLILSKAGVLGDGVLSLFRIANYHLYFIINLIIGDTATIADISWLKIIVLSFTVVLVPLLCQLFYYLGYKHIDLAEKLVYKSKK